MARKTILLLREFSRQRLKIELDLPDKSATDDAERRRVGKKDTIDDRPLFR